MGADMGTFGKCSGGGRRGAARENLPLVAVFTTLTRSHSAELIDISATGARLQSHDVPEEGDEILLSVDRLRAFGSVAWARPDEFGIAFEMSLHADEVDALREKVRATRGLSADMRVALDVWSAGSPR